MILTEGQIKDIILNNPNKDLVHKGVSYNKTLRMHIYGEGLDKEMHKIDGYEADDSQKLRAKYSRSNKDVFSRLSRPIDKVFSARGGSIYYNLSDAQDKQARSIALDIQNGISVRKWIETKWLPHLKDDPFGIIFFEILPMQEAILAKGQGKSVAYPTYKSICCIYDYLPRGGNFEYIVFNVMKEEKIKAGIDPDKQIYRVVDDAMDYYVQREGEEVSILKNQSFPNYFGGNVAIVNSDIISAEDDSSFLSIFDDAIELAKHFLIKGSIKLTHEFLHGFPKYWEYADACPECGGTKYSNGESCKSCKGTGRKIMLKVSDAKLLEYPSTKDEPIVAPNVAGYVSPDKTFYEIATADLQMLEELMNVTIWGSGSQVKPQGLTINHDQQKQTATEVMSDMKPESDRLKPISEMAEKRHKFLLDNIIRINLIPTYQGSSVNYGRRYIMEGPDEIWDKYENARIKGAPVSVLEDLLIEYYESKYQGDDYSLAIALKLMYVEPFVHLAPIQVDASPSITTEDKSAKTYFTEWLSTINDAMILSMSQELLREQLNTFAASKATAIQKAAKEQMTFENSFKKPTAA